MISLEGTLEELEERYEALKNLYIESAKHGAYLDEADLYLLARKINILKQGGD